MGLFARILSLSCNPGFESISARNARSLTIAGEKHYSKAKFQSCVCFCSNILHPFLRYHKDNPPEEIQKPLKSEPRHRCRSAGLCYIGTTLAGTNLVECGVSEWDNECPTAVLALQHLKQLKSSLKLCGIRTLQVCQHWTGGPGKW